VNKTITINKKSIIIAAIMAVVLLAIGGASGASADSQASPVVVTETPAVVTETPAVVTEAPVVVTEAPVVVTAPIECVAQEMRTELYADGDIADTVATVPLPDNVVLMGTHVLASSDVDGAVDAIIYVCSEQLTDDEVFALGTAFGSAIEASPAGNTLASLRLSLWVPDGAGAVMKSTRIRCEDFQVYLWGEALSDSSNWELAGRDY